MNKLDITETITVTHPDYHKELSLIGLLLSEYRTEEPSVLRWLQSIDNEVLEKYVIDHERSYIKFLEEESDELEKLSVEQEVWHQDLIACSLYLERLKRGVNTLTLEEDSDEPLKWLAMTKLVLRLEYEARNQGELGKLLKETKITDTSLQKSFNSMAKILKSGKLFIFQDKKDYKSVAIDGLFARMLDSIYDDKNIHKHDRVIKAALGCFPEKDNEKE